jgi:hypothetical protein
MTERVPIPRRLEDCDTFANTAFTGAIRLANPDAMQWVTFMPCGLRINMRTGEVVIPEDLTLDDASREFWQGLQQAFPWRDR